MSDYTTLCHRCGIFKQTHSGEYPCLCKRCSDYMVRIRKMRIEKKVIK